MNLLMKLSIASAVFAVALVCHGGKELPKPPLYNSQKIVSADKLKAGLEGEIDAKDVAGKFRQCCVGDYKVVDEQTVFRISYDSENLYLQVHCNEPEVANLKTAAFQRDGKLWEDDCVEIFISTNEKGRPYCQFIVNSAGVFFDARSDFGGKGEKQLWNSGAKTKAVKGGDWWGILLAVPWADLDVKDPDGSLLRINVCRTRKVSGTGQFSAWSPTRGGYHAPDRFGFVILGSLKDNLQKLLRLQTPTIVKGMELIDSKLKKNPAIKAVFDEKARKLNEKWQTLKRDIEAAPDNMSQADWLKLKETLNEIVNGVKNMNNEIDFEIVLQ